MRDRLAGVAGLAPVLRDSGRISWFTLGEYPHDWRRLEPVLRGLGATSLEVKTFSASYTRIWETRPPRASHVMTAVLTLAAVAVIWPGATGILQSDTESWIAKTLSALWALVTSAIIRGQGCPRPSPSPASPPSTRSGPRT